MNHMMQPSRWDMALVALIMWCVLVELPTVIWYWRKIKLLRQAIASHLDKNFPSVWNEAPSTQVLSIPRVQWLENSQLSLSHLPAYQELNRHSRILVTVVVLLAILSQSPWMLILLLLAASSHAQGYYACMQQLSHRVFDLQEQVWITRNRRLNDVDLASHHPTEIPRQILP